METTESEKQPEPSAPPAPLNTESSNTGETQSEQQPEPTSQPEKSISSPTLHAQEQPKDTGKKSSFSMGSVMKTGSNINKKLGLNKITRLLLFFFFFFFIFRIIDKIFIFFNINREIGYIYFIWATLFFFLFVILPLRKSYFNR